MNARENPHSGRIRSERKKRGWDTARMAAELRKASDQPAKLPGPASLQRSIQRWENGRIKKISERYRLLYAAAFDIPEAELFPHQQQKAPVPRNAENIADDEDMERRQLLSALLALGATAPAVEALNTIQGSVEHALSTDSAAHLDEWEGIVSEYGYTFLSTPAERLMPELAADLVAVRAHMSRVTASDPLFRSWCRVMSGLSMLMAKTLSSQLRGREARTWWTTAQQAADTSKDKNLSLWVSGERIVHGLYERRPTPILRLQADDLVQQAGTAPHRGMVTVLAARAQLLALEGRPADEALRQTEALYEQLPSSVTDERRSIAGWPEERLRYTEAFTHAHLGDARVADDVDTASGLYPKDRVRVRTQLELLRSLAMVNSGDVTTGTRCARRAWESAPEESRSLMVFAIAKDVLSAVPTSERRTPAVTEYRELLAANSPATTA